MAAYHSLQYPLVERKSSGRLGDGLFAIRSIRAGQCMCAYLGVLKIVHKRVTLTKAVGLVIETKTFVCTECNIVQNNELSSLVSASRGYLPEVRAPWIGLRLSGHEPIEGIIRRGSSGPFDHIRPYFKFIMCTLLCMFKVCSEDPKSIDLTSHDKLGVYNLRSLICIVNMINSSDFRTSDSLVMSSYSRASASTYKDMSSVLLRFSSLILSYSHPYLKYAIGLSLSEDSVLIRMSKSHIVTERFAVRVSPVVVESMTRTFNIPNFRNTATYRLGVVLASLRSITTRSPPIIMSTSYNSYDQFVSDYTRSVSGMGWISLTCPPDKTCEPKTNNVID